MILTPLFIGFPLLVGDLEHARLHPADANVYLHVPEVQAALAAYPQAPMLRLLADPELARFAARLLDRDPEGFDLGREVQALLRDGMGFQAGVAGSVIDLLGSSRSFSISLSSRGGVSSLLSGVDAVSGELALQCVLELGSAEHAAKALELLLSAAAPPAESEELPPLRLGDLSARPLPLDLPDPVSQAWAVAVGPTLLIGIGVAPERISQGLEEVARTLAGQPAFTAAGKSFREEGGLVLYESWYQITDLLDLARVQSSDMPKELLGTIGMGMGNLLGGDEWIQRNRVRLVGGVFVTETVHMEEGARSGFFGLLGTEPIDEAVFSYLPGDAVAAWLTRVRPEELVERVLGMLAESGVEPEDALLDLEKRYGLRPIEDLALAMGSRCAIYALPISGLTLPRIHAVVELRDPVAFTRGMEGLARLAQKLGESEIGVQTRPYRNVPLFTFSPRRNLGDLAGDVGAPAALASIAPNLIDPELSIAVVGQRALFGISSRSNKREIRRLQGDEGEGSSPHALSAAAGIPKGVLSVTYLDWGGMLGGFYASLRTLLPLIAQALPDLPFSVEEMPKAGLFERHLGPTLGWMRAGEHGLYELTRSSVGPEVPVVLLASIVGVALAPASFDGGANQFEILEIQPMAPTAPVAPSQETLHELQRKRTEEALRELKLAIVLYRGEHGKHPESLEDLLQGSANFPRGFLDGKALPLDGWERALHYLRDPKAGSFRLWSSGPDRIDDQGGGDDITLD